MLKPGVLTTGSGMSAMLRVAYLAYSPSPDFELKSRVVASPVCVCVLACQHGNSRANL